MQGVSLQPERHKVITYAKSDDGAEGSNDAVSKEEITRHSRLSGGFPGGSSGKESVCKAEDAGSTPGLGRCPGRGNGNPLQYSCLRNPMDRGAWWAYTP